MSAQDFLEYGWRIPFIASSLLVLVGFYIRLKITETTAFENAKKLYHELNGGKLYGKIKIVKLPKDKDVCDLKGNIDEYYIQIKD
jgi:hypothetical protein